LATRASFDPIPISFRDANESANVWKRSRSKRVLDVFKELLPLAWIIHDLSGEKRKDALKG
jgi:hypothetical protein